MDIRRFDLTQPPGPRMSRCVVRGDTVYLAGLTANDTSQDIKGQTQQILDKIDGYLAQAGTSKSNLLTANLWIKDMALFADMNAVWNAWVDPENPPARACVKADLARPQILVEIMVTAAKSALPRRRTIPVKRTGLSGSFWRGVERYQGDVAVGFNCRSSRSTGVREGISAPAPSTSSSLKRRAWGMTELSRLPIKSLYLRTLAAKLLPRPTTWLPMVDRRL